MEKEVRAMLDKGEKVTLIAKLSNNFIDYNHTYKLLTINEYDRFLIRNELNLKETWLNLEHLDKYFKLKQPKDPKELIGRKVKGFRFKDGSCGLRYQDFFEQYVGEIGIINSISPYGTDNYVIKFDNGKKFIYPSDQIEAHLLPEKKTKKERIEELENLYQKLEEKFEAFCSEFSEKVVASQHSNNISATEGISGAFSYAIDSAQKQAPEFWYVDIVEEKDSELLPKFKEWYLKKAELSGFAKNWSVMGYAGRKNDNGYDREDNAEDFKNSDKMQKITLNEWNKWFNK
jgi:hypothetical protein